MNPGKDWCEMSIIVADVGLLLEVPAGASRARLGQQDPGGL